MRRRSPALLLGSDGTAGFHVRVGAGLASALSIALNSVLEVSAGDRRTYAWVKEVPPIGGLLASENVFAALGSERRVVMVRPAGRVYSASEVEFSLEAYRGLELSELRALVESLRTFRAVVGRGSKLCVATPTYPEWVLLEASRVRPREPAVIVRETNVFF